MSDVPKEKKESEKETDDARDAGSWSEDQKKREYYYDDAHGYEVYEPDEEETEDD